MKAWLDGRVVDPAAPAISLDDLGFLRGYACFETMKVLRGEPFALGRHLARLRRSCDAMGIAVPDEGTVRTACAEVLAANAGGPEPVGLVRVTVTEAGRLAVIVGAPRPAVASVDAVVCPWVRNERSGIAGVKSTSYAENVVAERWAAERGAEPLFANTRGELCESATSNVFLALGGRLVTPPLSSGCLAGVTRDLLVEDPDLGVEELDIPIEALAEATEAFLTSSTRDVQPVGRLDGRPLDAPGPLTRRAMAAWQAIEARTVEP